MGSVPNPMTRPELIRSVLKKKPTAPKSIPVIIVIPVAIPAIPIKAVTVFLVTSSIRKILSYIKSQGYTAQAATTTSKYAPSVCANGSICGAGEWYLPALGELVTLYDNISTISSKLSSAGGEGIVMSYYWSSTEYSAVYAWTLGFANGYRGAPDKNNSYYVRPVLAF